MDDLLDSMLKIVLIIFMISVAVALLTLVMKFPCP